MFRRGRPGGSTSSIAGIPAECLTPSFLHETEAFWFPKNGSIAQVALYILSLDGVGYVLKLPSSEAGRAALEKMHRGHCWEDSEPILSKSLLPTLRRASM